MNLIRRFENHFFKLFVLLNLAVGVFLVSCNPSGKRQISRPITSIDEYRKLRSLKLNQYRPVIHNNDGCDAYLYPLKFRKYIPENENHPRSVFVFDTNKVDYDFSISNFLNIRSAGLIGTDVSTISYCSIASSFGQFTHNTKVGEFLTLTHQRPGKRNVVPEFVKLGTDPLEVTAEFARENGFEFFWSNRINDCHDSGHRPDNPYERWSKLKQKHPEYLFGAPGEALPHGRWSAVDFSHSEIRDLCVQYYNEVCENYDVDGIELDFFRSVGLLFRNVARGEVATQEQLDMLTDMVSRIREVTEQTGMKKGKPILVLVRLPDDIEYCRGIGIDLEKWMEKGLVDIVVGSCLYRLNPWVYLVEKGHRYGIKVYAGLSEPRIQKEHPLLIRLQNPVYRARSAAAWQAGVDGLYVFNESNTRSLYLSEIGNADKLKDKNNLYFATYLYWNPESPLGSLKDGKKYYNLPLLTPSNTAFLTSKPLELSLEIGDENTTAKVVLILYSNGGSPGTISATINGISLKYKKSTSDGLSVFEIPQDAVKSGENQLLLSYAAGQNSLTLSDAAILFFRNYDDPETKELSNICFSN